MAGLAAGCDAVGLSAGGKKHPYREKVTTRDNLATLVLIITFGCSHAYVGRIINVKILIRIMI